MPSPGRGTLVLLGVLTAFGPLAFDMYLPALPLIATDLRTSDALVQLTLSLCMVGMGIGQVVAGPVSDRVGRRLPLLVGVSLFVIGVAATAVAPTIETMLVARLVTGLGGGAGVVLARAMVRDLYSGVELSRAFAVTGMVFGVAPVIGPLIGAVVLRVTDWRGVFVVLTVVGVVLLVLAARLGETLPAPQRQEGGLAQTARTFRSLIGQRDFIAAVAVVTLAQGPLNLYLALSSLVLQRHYGLTAQQFGVVFAVNALAIVLASRACLSLVGRHGPRRLLVVAVWAGAGAMLVLTVGVLTRDSLWTVLLMLFVMMGCVGFVMPNGAALALAGQTRTVGAAAALMGLIQFTVAAAVAPLVALLGVTAPIWAISMLVLSLLAIVPMLLLPRTAQQ